MAAIAVVTAPFFAAIIIATRQVVEVSSPGDIVLILVVGDSDGSFSGSLGGSHWSPRASACLFARGALVLLLKAGVREAHGDVGWADGVNPHACMCPCRFILA